MSRTWRGGGPRSKVIGDVMKMDGWLGDWFVGSQVGGGRAVVETIKDSEVHK